MYPFGTHIGIPLYNGIAACGTFVYVLCRRVCVAHSIAPPDAQFSSVILCLLVFIPNITGVLRLGIKAGLPVCQSYALTTTLSAPRVLKFEK